VVKTNTGDHKAILVNTYKYKRSNITKMELHTHKNSAHIVIKSNNISVTQSEILSGKN
jgi:hypothetical protein